MARLMVAMSEPIFEQALGAEFRFEKYRLKQLLELENGSGGPAGDCNLLKLIN